MSIDKFRCIPPCLRAFDTQKKLIHHYQNRSSCKAAWAECERELSQGAFEDASSVRRATVRELAIESIQIQDEESRSQIRDSEHTSDAVVIKKLTAPM
jgi:hypothetical protein